MFKFEITKNQIYVCLLKFGLFDTETYRIGFILYKLKICDIVKQYWSFQFIKIYENIHYIKLYYKSIQFLNFHFRNFLKNSLTEYCVELLKLITLKA